MDEGTGYRTSYTGGLCVLSTKSQLAKMQKLLKLEQWATKNFKVDEYESDEMTRILVKYCRSEFASSRGQATDYALTVQLRLLTSHMKRQAETIKANPVPLPVELEEKLTIGEILQNFHARQDPPPKTDFEVQEED